MEKILKIFLNLYQYRVGDYKNRHKQIPLIRGWELDCGMTTPKYRILYDLAYSEEASIEITATCMGKPLKTDYLQRYYGVSEVKEPHLWS